MVELLVNLAQAGYHAIRTGSSFVHAESAVGGLHSVGVGYNKDGAVHTRHFRTMQADSVGFDTMYGALKSLDFVEEPSDVDGHSRVWSRHRDDALMADGISGSIVGPRATGLRVEGFQVYDPVSGKEFTRAFVYSGRSESGEDPLRDARVVTNELGSIGFKAETSPIANSAARVMSGIGYLASSLNPANRTRSFK